MFLITMPPVWGGRRLGRAMPEVKGSREEGLEGYTSPSTFYDPHAQPPRLAARVCSATLVPASPSPSPALPVPFFVSILAGGRLLCQEDSALSLRQPVCRPAPPPCLADLRAPPSGPRPPALVLLLPPARAGDPPYY